MRAGEWDARTDKERLPYQERDVVGVTLHEGFDRAVLYNDVALLILDSSVELDEHIGTVCLPSQGQRVQSDNCFASGWGKNVFGTPHPTGRPSNSKLNFPEGQYQMILKKVELPMVDASRCLSQLRKTRLGRRFILHDSFTCAGGEEGKDTCKVRANATAPHTTRCFRRATAVAPSRVPHRTREPSATYRLA